MALSSRPHHLLRPLLRGFHASAQALARAEPHEFSKPTGYLGSWEPAEEPREAWAQLDRLRKGYARDVRQLRREYAYEVQLMEASGSGRPRRVPRPPASPTRSARQPRPPPRRRARPSGAHSRRTSARPL